MDHENIQNQELNLVLSSDAKPRLKWTPELHQRFIDSVTQLGGPEKATPKSLMRAMGIHGLTLYHLKSHLQKYRLGKIQRSPTCSVNTQEEFGDDLTSIDQNDVTPKQINESMKIAQALQIQMEVQRKLHEQIEVQKLLQLRIEAQGKYLQSVLRKAQDTLAGYNSSAIEVEAAKAELSHLVSMVDNGCPSSITTLTEIEDPILKKDPKKTGTGSSLESSLTSSGSSGSKENDDLVLKLTGRSEISNSGSGRKRSGSTISDGNCQGKRLKKGSERFDLNSQYVNDVDYDFDFQSKSNTIDLNLKLKS